MPNRFQLLLLLPLACYSSRHTSTYQYEEVYVTRVDEPGHTDLYWGKTIEQTTPCVSIAYPGFDSGIDGFLVFNPDKSVNAIGVMGYYTTTDSTCRLTIKNINNEQFILWNDSVGAGKFSNVYWLTENKQLEQEQNKAYKSAVQYKPVD